MTPLRWLDAHSAADAARALRAHAPHAQAIAAGGDLLGLMKEGVQGPTLPAPQVLVNLGSAADLTQLTLHDDALHIGAMVTLARLAREPHAPPMLVDAIAHIASPQLRARTTVGGNLLQRPRCWYFRHPDVLCFKKGGTGCAALGGPEQAHPGALFPGLCHAGHPSDLAPVLIALDAQALVVGADGERRVLLGALYDGAGINRESEVQLRRDEVLAALIVPRRACAQAFEKVAPRDANEFSWSGAAVALRAEGDTITDARIVLSGVAPGPWPLAAEPLVGRRGSAIDAAQMAALLIAPPVGVNDSPHHAARVHAARWAVQRALQRALADLPTRAHDRTASNPHNPH